MAEERAEAGAEPETAPGDGVPESIEEALARARRHARASAAEAAAALRALLDAASLATAGEAARDSAFGPLATALDRARAWIDPDDARDGAAVLRALAEALDAEIARWEERSRDDPEARSVVRAFLGVRELLWELGVRPDAQAGADDENPEPQQRVQRVSVEG